VALPTISAELLSSLSVLQWVATAYLLTITSLLPVFGRTADIIGRKRIYSQGFLIFTSGSLLCGVAHNIWLLILMRVLQAIGASMMMANSFAIISAAFSPRERGRALGLIGTVVALGSMTGPVLGGFLVGLVSWRSIFLVNIPIGIIGFLASQIILPADQPQEIKETFDYGGAFFFTSGMLCLLFAISEAPDQGWDSAAILAFLLAGVLLLTLFIITETRVKHALIDFSLFKIRLFLFGNISGLTLFTAVFTYVLLMPFYLQQILNYSPAQVGLLMTAFPLVTAFAAPISGTLSDKIGPVILTTGGLLITAAGLFYLSTLTAQAAAWQIIPGPILMGLGSGMFQAPNNSSVMSSVPPPKLGVAGGITALVRNMGMVIGIVSAVSIFENHRAAILTGLSEPSLTQLTYAFLDSFHTVMRIGAIVALFGALISLNRKS
jgi:EmrB/QacA subfamily drug resistance transporter